MTMTRQWQQLGQLWTPPFSLKPEPSIIKRTHTHNCCVSLAAFGSRAGLTHKAFRTHQFRPATLLFARPLHGRRQGLWSVCRLKKKRHTHSMRLLYGYLVGSLDLDLPLDSERVKLLQRGQQRWEGVQVHANGSRKSTNQSETHPLHRPRIRQLSWFVDSSFACQPQSSIRFAGWLLIPFRHAQLLHCSGFPFARAEKWLHFRAALDPPGVDHVSTCTERSNRALGRSLFFAQGSVRCFWPTRPQHGIRWTHAARLQGLSRRHGAPSALMAS